MLWILHLTIEEVGAGAVMLSMKIMESSIERVSTTTEKGIFTKVFDTNRVSAKKYLKLG